MRITAAALHTLIADLCAGASAHDIAIGHNFRFDEQPEPDRAVQYNRDSAPGSADYNAWQESHGDYLRSRVQVSFREVPETFSASLNGPALREPAGEMTLLRLEDLRGPLQKLHMAASDLINAWTVDHGCQEITDLVTALNNRPGSGGRPRFACFEHEVQGEVAGDWPNLLRDRLGLAHLNPAEPWPNSGGSNGPIPVALMRYQLRDVYAAVPVAERSRAVAVPSVLDSEFNPHFFPAPTDLGFGRTMALNSGEERLVSEILHRRLDYRPSHIFRLGLITAALPTEPLRDLRNWHRLCVIEDARLDDTFGEEVPAHAVG